MDKQLRSATGTIDHSSKKSIKGWRPAERSAHFGKRKTIVQAKTIEKYGETIIEVYKPMLLKNALKKNLTFKWN